MVISNRLIALNIIALTQHFSWNSSLQNNINGKVAYNVRKRNSLL